MILLKKRYFLKRFISILLIYVTFLSMPVMAVEEEKELPAPKDLMELPASTEPIELPAPKDPKQGTIAIHAGIGVDLEYITSDGVGLSISQPQIFM